MRPDGEASAFAKTPTTRSRAAASSEGSSGIPAAPSARRTAAASIASAITSWNPAPGSPRSPCSISLTSRTPTKFSISVTSTSCTLRVSRTSAASAAHAAPPSAPASAAMIGSTNAGAPGRDSATHVAARPPTAICPSPPMLMTCAREHSAAPSAVRRYGVVLFSATATRSGEPSAPLASEP